MRAKDFTENKLSHLITKHLLLEKALPDNHLAVAVLGAPASGKSYMVNLIKNLANKENSKKMATVMDPDNKTNTVLTVDKLRSELQNMSLNEQLYGFYQAYGYIRQLAVKDPENYDKWVAQIRKTWEKIDDESDEITTGVGPNGTLIFNNSSNSEEVKKLIDQIDPTELKKILSGLDQYEDYKRVVRWFQNIKQTQAKQNKNNIVYDEAGDEPDKIIERMKNLRDDQDPYITLIFLIHSKSPVTNLIQNAFRMVSGGDDGRDSSGAIIQAWNDIQSGIGKYYESAESVITVSGEKEIVQSFNTMARINTDDNDTNPNKYVDLLAIVRTQTPEQAYELFSSKLSSDPLALAFFNAILLFNSRYTKGLNSESKQILSKLVGTKIKDLYSTFTQVVKSGKFNHKLNNLQRMYAQLQQDTKTIAPVTTKTNAPSTVTPSSPGAREKVNTVTEEDTREVTKVFCDVDGVLADFDNGTKKYTSTFNNNWSDLPDDFFTKLDKLPGSTELVNSLQKEFGENFYILTAIPKRKRGKISLRAKQDKIEWLTKNFGIPSNKIIVVYREEKRDFADPNSILIDDTSQNIQEWEEAGGIGIYYKNYKQALETIKNRVKK